MDKPKLNAEVQFFPGIWTDVNSWLLNSANIRRGSTRVESPIVRYEAGHATIKLNNKDRRFDPTNLYGPYVQSGVSRVTPMRPCRITAEWNSTTYPLFRGFVDEWDIGWVSNVYSDVTVPITDGFKVLANKRRAPVIPSVGAEEDTGARITRILDSTGWPVGDRSIAVGNSLLRETDLSGNALAELQTAAESEVGELYIDASGKVVFRNRHAVLLDTRSTQVQFDLGTFGDMPAPFLTRLSTDDATLWNEVKAQSVGGIVQIREDSDSVALNQYKTLEKTQLMLTDTISTSNYAEWILYISKDPEVRFDSVEIHPMGDPITLFPQVLTREIGDRIRITVNPSGGGLPIVREVFIRGIAHNIEQSKWVTTWHLQSATRYAPNFFLLDSPTNGVLDQNILSY